MGSVSGFNATSTPAPTPTPTPTPAPAGSKVLLADTYHPWPGSDAVYSSKQKATAPDDAASRTSITCSKPAEIFPVSNAYLGLIAVCIFSASGERPHVSLGVRVLAGFCAALMIIAAPAALALTFLWDLFIENPVRLIRQCTGSYIGLSICNLHIDDDLYQDSQQREWERNQRP